MAAPDPVLPPEEVALLELGKVVLDKVPPAPAEPPEDPDATLPWDQCQHSTRGQPEPVEPKRRSSPEGGREDPEEAVPPCPPAEAEDEEGPGLPVMAAHVFVPIDPQCIEQSPCKQKQQHSTPWPREEGREGHVLPRDRPSSLHHKQVLLPMVPSRYRDPLGFEGHMAKALEERSQFPCARDCGTDNLKAMASVAGALLLCPCLIYGAYIFLPFDAPLLPTVSARLVYTLRCAAFATFPVVLGMIVSGISRLCSSALEPFGELQREVEIHRTYVSQSIHLFILYFFNMAVLVTYLPQELLKLIPLLTGLFAISRLIFWLSYAMGRSFRAFGFCMTFLPLLAMLLWNLYGMFVLEPENLLAVAAAKPEGHTRESGAKLRHWG
ncbi:PREDICTED: transmembrane protein 79 [Acanthisitta chloris]|uniref:transmembrane protein 79 n=1 Tax=Acanthisitta chloris TaxID=57068 RepID=UPI0004F0D49E|nr:PREDICTED: transmembrane protein 79 [Acanthisitta chloris]